MASDLITKIKAVPKNYYTLNDLEKISKMNRPSLRVTLTRLVKRRDLRRLAKGIYQLSEQPFEIEKTATQIYRPSYISFESALAKFGILSQIPYTLSLATLKKPKKILIANRPIEYRHLNDKFFWGYFLENGAYIAEPEKALLDELYLVTKGYAQLDLKDLDLSDVNLQKLQSLAKKYPQTVSLLARKLIKTSGI